MAIFEQKIDEVLERVTRLNRDVERIKLMSGITLGTDRGIALLASGDRIYIDPRDRGCGINLLTEGVYEEEEISLFRRFLKPGATVLDIGANYGYYSITAAPYVRPGGRVYAFEPNPHIFELMSSSAFVNGYTDVITPCQTGVFDTNSTLRFAIDETGPGGARIILDDFVPSERLKVIDVPVVPIDQFLPKDTIVDLVKIDVEGREQNVLKGMEETIRRSPDIVILMELFYSFFEDEKSFRNFIEYIGNELGLKIFHAAGEGRLKTVGFDDLVNKESYVLLAKNDIADGPALTIYADQLNVGVGGQKVDGRLEWSASGVPNELVCHGPYVFLPQGSYHVKIFGDFEGAFRFKIQENYGDVLWENYLHSNSDLEFDFNIRFCAPRMEVAFWSMGDSGKRFNLNRIEFWR